MEVSIGMMLPVTLFDYGVGNIHSLSKAMEAVGARVRVEEDPREILNARILLLPGVGALCHRMSLLGTVCRNLPVLLQ